MPITLTPLDLAIRLGLTLLAAALVGINRGERGRPAGLRTTMLVCLAASFSMLLANALIDTTGKTQSFFTQMDVMRLPLGILTGVGFLGAGAIVRKGSVVVGLTTAATLWFVTVMGFCFGAGKHVLGGSALAVALLVVWGLKHIEKRSRIDRRGSLHLSIQEDGPHDPELRKLFEQHRFEVSASGIRAEGVPRILHLRYELIWRACPEDSQPPSFLPELLDNRALVAIEWMPQSVQEHSQEG
jgi:putative Mg2+ transporter-C (MgtC) family protein